MSTRFGNTALSEEAQDAMFGDLTALPDPPPDPDPDPEASAPATEGVHAPSVEEPVEPEAPGDDPAQITPDEGVVEPAPGEAAAPPTEEAVVEAPPLSEDETWKKRYDDVRTNQMRALEESRKRAEFAETQLAQFISSQSEARISPERIEELTRRAEEAGLDPAQVNIYADITSEAVSAREKAYVDQMTSNAERARQEAAQAEQSMREEILTSYAAAHPDLTPELNNQVARFLHDVEEAYFVDRTTGEPLPFETPFEEKLQAGVLQPRGPLRPEMLEFAYHAVVEDPALGKTLAAMPQLMDTEYGMAMAHRLASQVDPPATTRPNPQVIDQKLAAAETLGGPSAPAPVQEESLLNIPEKKFFSQ